MYNFVTCKVCYHVLVVTFPMPHDRGCEIKIIVIVIVTEMKTMMAKVLRAVGVKEKGKELTDSHVEVSSDDEFVDVRSRKKKRRL